MQRYEQILFIRRTRRISYTRIKLVLQKTLLVTEVMEAAGSVCVMSGIQGKIIMVAGSCMDVVEQVQ
jgi:hypothetical protein